MKILFLTPGYHPSVGGAETYVQAIAGGLVASGEDLMVLTDGPALPSPPLADVAQVRRLPGLATTFASPNRLGEQPPSSASLEYVQQALSEFGVPDIVFANGSDVATLARIVGDTFHIPVVANFHEHATEFGPLGRGRARLAFQRLDLDAIIVGSEVLAEKAIEYGARVERVHLIRHGVDTNIFTPGRPGLQSSKPASLQITLSGNITPRKQQHLMVRVLERLVDEAAIDAHLAFIGQRGPESDYAISLDRQIANSPVKERIHFRTDVGLRDMPAVYQASDIVVQPSTAEGLGLSVLEAMACAVPVVVSDTTGLQEIIRDIRDGILVHPTSEDDWVDVLAFVANDQALRRRLGENARELIEERFSEAQMVRQTRALLMAIVAGWSTGHGGQPRLIEE